MRDVLPKSAPKSQETWEAVFADIEEVVFKGMTHWHSSGFLAYFPCGISYPDLLAEMLIASCTSIGFSWVNNYKMFFFTTFLLTCSKL